MQFLWTTIHNYMHIKHYNHIPPFGLRKLAFRVFSYKINIYIPATLFYGRHSVELTKFFFHNCFTFPWNQFNTSSILCSILISGNRFPRFTLIQRFVSFFVKTIFLRKSDTWYLNRSYFSVPYVLISLACELYT